MKEELLKLIDERDHLITKLWREPKPQVEEFPSQWERNSTAISANMFAIQQLLEKKSEGKQHRQLLELIADRDSLNNILWDPRTLNLPEAYAKHQEAQRKLTRNRADIEAAL